MRAPRSTICSRSPSRQEQLQKNLVVRDAVDNHLPGQSATLPEPEPLVEPQCSAIRRPDLDDQLFVSRLRGEAFGCGPQFVADALSTPVRQQEGAHLSGVRHGGKRRPQVQNLKSDDA